MVRDVEPAGSTCVACIELGDTWVHLRSCMTCGLVGCCDSSKNRHASRHAAHADHPIARSLEPGEDWWWCFIDATMVEQPRPTV
ncbi:MAG: UBP-type zinc finger domain-containing protein [Myxococcota bacterium]